jgi:hypothetical protein
MRVRFILGGHVRFVNLFILNDSGNEFYLAQIT